MVGGRLSVKQSADLRGGYRIHTGSSNDNRNRNKYMYIERIFILMILSIHNILQKCIPTLEYVALKPNIMSSLMKNAIYL